MVMNMRVMLVMKVEVMVIMSRMKRISESDDGNYLKKSAVKVCNVDHTAAGLITPHLILLLPKKKINLKSFKPFKIDPFHNLGLVPSANILYQPTWIV